MLSISRQAENRPHKHLRFTLRNNIQVHTVDEAQMSIFREVIDQATDKESHSIAGMFLNLCNPPRRHSFYVDHEAK